MRLDEFEKHSIEPRLQSLIGARALCGITQFSENQITKQDIFDGIILRYLKGKAIIKKTFGEEAIIPIKYDDVVFPPRGSYQLDNGTEVKNPDCLISWRLDIKDPIVDSDWKPNTAPFFYSIVGKEWDFEYSGDDREYYKRQMEVRAKDIIGKNILLGITNKRKSNDEEEILEKKQYFGKIIRATFHEGVVIQKSDNSEITLPPDITYIQKAPPGEYKLRSSGEIIINPEYLSIWEIISKQ
jgi:hypothetical protein